jgi:hypothetical protein
MEWLLTHLEREAYMIEGAPIIFGFTILLITGLLWWLMETRIYGPRLKARDELIQLYKQKLDFASASASDGLNAQHGISRPFSLTQEQYAKVVASLSKFTLCPDQSEQRGVTVYVSPAAPENRRFAMRLVDAFGEAGWATRYGGEYDLEGCRTGVWIIPIAEPQLVPPTDEALRDALIAVDIPVRIDRERVAQIVYIVVGAKAD